MNGYMMSGWGFMMGFGWLIFILAIVGVVYFMNNSSKNDEPSAKDILDKRYANGEIDEEEYKRKKENLR
ncbi:SHOCT domain-containing protein [Sulfurimonas sp. HSL-1716]|uniref:SHOCT domain-containing protein n=1 Tax=Hydrocurvibacter sulfurireducens TaxID=3131937 RepID=UPI0031F92570